MGRKNHTSSTTSTRTHDAIRKPGLLARLAGMVGLRDEVNAESLEQRQLLFTITVAADSVNPNTGIGTAEAYFAYVVPSLIGIGTVQTTPGTTVTEGFDTQPVGPRASGTFYAASPIRLLHSIGPAQDAQIEPLANGQGTNDRWMKFSLNETGEFFAFECWNDAQNPQFRRQASSVSFTIRDNSLANGGFGGDVTGLVTDNIIVELLSNDIVTASFTGAALRNQIQQPGGNANLGTGTFQFNAPANFPGFDTVRVRAIAPIGNRPDFQLDNLNFVLPAGRFAGTIGWSGAYVRIDGPVGASATIVDLYGRDMIQTLRVGTVPGGQVLFVDGDDNGIPNFNDGIGRITLNGTDSRTSFSMWGAAIQEAAGAQAPQNVDTWDGLYSATLFDDLKGRFDDFEGTNGFGYVFRVNGTQRTAAGLPPGPGSVIIGSPFVRPQNAYNPGGIAPGVANPITTGFTRADQGIFVNGDINGLMIHGVVHGSSQVHGFADRVNIGYLVGSLSVDGDLGSLIVGSDAGIWAPDPGFQPPPNVRVDPINKTNAQLVVGRTVGEIASAGRFEMDVTVVGDLNSPQTRPARNSFDYYEKEWSFGTGTTGITELDTIRRQVAANSYVSRTPADIFRTSDQGMLFGVNNFLRNDSVMGAEWVGSASSGVRVRGDLSGVDVFNGEDRADVFAFAVDGTSEVVIEGANSLANTSPYYRILDQDGRTLAAPQLPLTAGRFTATKLRFTPSAPGVYYLVVSDPNGNDTGSGSTPYTVVITGMATTTLGAIRSGGGFGFTDINTGEGNSVNVLSGSVGSIRVGTGIVDDGGEDGSPLDTYNTVQDDDDSLSFQGGTISTAKSLYNITCGSDFGAPHTVTAPPDVVILVGGDFGTLYTGLNPVVGGGPGEGDLNFLNLSVGGSIGVIDVRGGIGMDQDNTNDPRGSRGANIVNIRTGTNGGAGDIGYFRTGFHIYGDSANITTSPGSTIGAFLTSQDSYFDTNQRSGIYLGQRGLPIRSNFGSDVRFVDLIRLDLSNSVNVVQPIVGDRPLQLVDDSGAQFTITVEGAPTDVQIGSVFFMPIDGSQGVAVGQISVDLSGGRTLRITPTSGGGSTGTGGVIGIGRINIVNSDAASAVEISGTVEVDVLRLDAPGGLDHLFNNTPGGDIVAADVATLNTLSVWGDLGTTQWSASRPYNFAPFLGVGNGHETGVGGVLGVGGGGLFDNDFNGDIFRPIADDNFNQGNAYLDDIGGPFDGWLNGIVIRNGNLAQADIRGSLGDLILQDDAGTILQLTVNQDRISGLGKFDGIVGTVYARDIQTIDVGDGVLNTRPESPLASSGIFAEDDILSLMSQRTTGVRYSGIIIAGNATDPDLPGSTQEGINSFRINNGTVDGLFLASQNLDGFWTSFNFTEEDFQTGDVSELTLTGTNFFRSDMRFRQIRTVNITGYFDASSVNASGDVGTFTATGYRNSTLTGDASELRENLIEGARDINSLIATLDIQDLTVDFTGRVRQGITARNVERSSIDVDNELLSLAVTNDLRGSDLNVGALPTLTVGRNIQSTTIAVSGPLTSVTVGNKIGNSDIQVTGANGAIGTITALSGISGSIAAAGPIGTITVTAGDLTAAIRTTTANGNVTALSASRDVAITADISGNLGTITAGRHLGSASTRGAVVIRGNLTSASAPNGQLYGDLRVGGAILGAITIGGASAKPENNQVGQGSILAFKSIASVTINGDFDGDILSFSGGLGAIAINNGSLLPGNTIAAYDGSITSLVITNGSLFGNVHADRNITSLRVVAGADGVFGDIGVNSAMSANVSYDARRNQLPVGVSVLPTFQGPRISAGQNIVSVVVTNGSVFESSFVAGRAIQNISISGGVSNDPFTTGFGSFFAAGDSIDNISITGNASDAMFLAGVLSLGTDNRPGGTGAAADAVKAGNVTKVSVNGNTARSQFLAGITPGGDGVYNTSDDQVALGVSTIGTLNLGSVGANVVARGDVLSNSVGNDNRLIRSGSGLASANPDLDTGAGVPGTSFSGSRTFAYSGANVTINVSGPGAAFFDTASGRLTIRNGTSGTNVTVSSSTGTINNFDLVTNDEGSLGSVSIQAALTGDSDVAIDGSVGSLTFNNVSGTGTIAVGGSANTMTFANLSGGYVQGASVQTFRVTGDYGASNSLTLGEVNVQLVSAGAITINGAARGTISVDRDATSLTVSGAVDRASFRFGNNLGTFSAASMSRSLLSVGDGLTTATIGGEMFHSSIMAGLDLGRDAAFDANGLDVGAEGLNADAVSTGTIGTVSVAGNFRESDVVAGFYRGKDGFFGSTDDTVASGRSTIGTVTIVGSQVGSTRSSESYRIASSGTITSVLIAGAPFTGAFGNFAVDAPNLAPMPVQVADLRVNIDGGVSIAEIQFNQGIDASTLNRALNIAEVRGSGGNVTISLIEGPDYTVAYRPGDTTAVITFSRTLTSQSLPVVPGKPGAGVYRFFINHEILRPKLVGQGLDGDADGHSTSGDHFSQDAVVGDAGDKLTAGTATSGTTTVDFYAPINLDLVLDNNYAPDGVADTNKTVTIRGSIGDHPDNNTNVFSFASDVDLYAVTLQAGQIVRIGALSGPALNAGFNFLTSTGAVVNRFANNATALALPTDRGSARDLTFPETFLIKQTGVYLLAVGNSGVITNVGATNAIPNIATPPGGVGNYNFTLQVFDDLDSGFTSTTNSGDGTAVVTAPSPIAFAGSDQTFGTIDDTPEIVIGNFTFTLNRGADGLPNTADDVVSGDDASGITSSLNGAGQASALINSAIGPAGHAGVPSEIAADVDVFHLNNRQPIAAGTTMKITVRLTDLGANLGSATAPPRDRNAQRVVVDNRGFVQFGLFDTSASSNVEDADVVFSPTDFRSFGGPANTTLGDNGATTYGYDANGDFFIQFVVPDRLGVPGASGTYAVYIQGATNSDYSIEVLTNPSAITPAPKTRQNVFLETRGGTVDWLQVGGVTTNLAGFDARTLGFSGAATNGQPVNTYAIDRLVASLNSLYQGAGFDVVFSADPSAFQFQQFSTVYLSATNDPVSAIFSPFNLFNFDLANNLQLAGVTNPNPAQGFFSTQPFGFSQRSDSFNANLEDEAVVFVPSFSLQGFTPSQSDLDGFVQSLTGAVSRRVGELMGLRISEVYAAAGPFDSNAANSPQTLPGAGRAYSLSNTSRGLSDAFDSVQSTDFFLGRQNAFSLLDKVLNRL